MTDEIEKSRERKRKILFERLKEDAMFNSFLDTISDKDEDWETHIYMKMVYVPPKQPEEWVKKEKGVHTREIETPSGKSETKIVIPPKESKYSKLKRM
jgi:hypothetical protein